MKHARQLRVVFGIGGMLWLLTPGCSPPIARKELPLSALIPPAEEDVGRPNAPKVKQVGTASWYGQALDGKKTASGEPFDPNALTAAHPTLPLGTMAVVTNLKTGKSVTVTITDRGPYVKGRKIDLSRAAARKIGMSKTGVAKVKIESRLHRKPTKAIVAGMRRNRSSRYPCGAAPICAASEPTSKP